MKRACGIILPVTLAIAVMAVPAKARYSGGDGSPDYPYRIATANDLNDIGNHHLDDFDKHFVLVNDINLACIGPNQFTIIGSVSYPFKGVFDGNSHTISSLRITYSGTALRVGLFGRMSAANAEIRDLTMVEPDINAPSAGMVAPLVGFLGEGKIARCSIEGGNVRGDYQVGGLVGRNDSGSISNCSSSADVVALRDHAGGLVGVLDLTASPLTDCYATGTVRGRRYVGGLVGTTEVPIVNCYATGSVDANRYAGGLAGTNWSAATDPCGAIFRCFATGDVTVLEEWAGGLVGFNADIISECFAVGSIRGGHDIGGLVGQNSGANGFARIERSFATGDVNGTYNVGGLLGFNYRYEQSGVVHDCYSTGHVSGETDVGGLVGWVNKDCVYDSFWDVNTSGDPNSSGGTGLTTPQMQMRNTFTNAGWDFVNETANGPNDIWTINEGLDYPVHVWPLVNLVGWYEVDLKDFAAFAAHWQHNCPAPCAAADLIQDDIINLADYSAFAQYWGQTDCNHCGGADLTGDNDVDAEDLYLFTSFWLSRNFDCTADFDFSGRIDESDLAIFSEYWLTGR